MKILITAPSLDENRNVSGISSVVRQIIDHGTFEYIHFAAGRQDGERIGTGWLMKQALLPARFIYRILSSGADVVQINTALTEMSIWRDSILIWFAKLAGKPVVLGIQGGKYLMQDVQNIRLEGRIGKMLGRSDTVMVLSDLERQMIDERWPGLNIHVLPNAVPIPDFPPRKTENDPPVLIFFGRFHESKGIQDIVEACRILSNDSVDFEFRAYGDGPAKEEFLAGMHSAIGGHFVYGGVISGTDKLKTLAGADIFVLPSRYGEGLPLAMLEAMAAGLIVVVSDNASITSVVEDGVNGFVVKPGDPRLLAETIASILSDRSSWNAIQNAASATVRSKFAIERYIANLENLYRKTAGK